MQNGRSRPVTIAIALLTTINLLIAFPTVSLANRATTYRHNGQRHYPLATRLLSLSPVRGVARIAQRRACLPHASAPEVPICAASGHLGTVVMCRPSAPAVNTYDPWRLGYPNVLCRDNVNMSMVI